MYLKDETEVYEVNGKIYPCGTSLTMDLIGGKWKAVILYYLKDGKLRYKELRKKIPFVTERTLSIQLRQLEEDDIIRREVYNLKPPLKVEYSLTEFGTTLLPIILAIASWGSDLAMQKGVRKKIEID